MNVKFHDLERDDNPRNGDCFTAPDELLDLLYELSCSRSPFMCELVGDNGFTLLVGIGGETGCVQHSPDDGAPPYLMAVDPTASESTVKEMDFLVGGTATPIRGRYCLAFATFKNVVAKFVSTGNRSRAVNWEEFDAGGVSDGVS
jgi:hypothetical protein